MICTRSFPVALLAAALSLAPQPDVVPVAGQGRGPVVAGDAGGDPSGGLSATAWASLREAFEAARHSAVVADGALQSRSPGQGWLARFDGRGFTVIPDAGGWTWGLRVVRYGFPGAERTVSRPTRVSNEGARVVYDWDDCLVEWYVNGASGLEHGFTLQRRPEPGAGPLSVTLELRGELQPMMHADGRGLSLLTARGEHALSYSGLAVFDADGRDLPARLECQAGVLSVSLEDAGARYPVTIDPIVQQAYLKASNTEAEDRFGWSVAVSGDTAVVGATNEDSSATGVNGNQANNGAPGSGAAYVFVRNGATWSQQAYLKASNTGAGDLFGVAVAVSGDTIVVAAEEEDSSATGVDGDQSGDGAIDSGAVYVFVRDGTNWSQQAYIKASNTGASDKFGESGVAVHLDTIVVGTKLEDSDATGVDGEQTNNGAPASGAAYVFVREGTVWSQQAYLKASNAAAGDFFGNVSVWGDTVVVGAVFEDSAATGVDGDQGSNVATTSGAAYVFVREGTVWSQQAYLKASNTGAGDQFGSPLRIGADTLIIGAAGEDSNATGVNGDQANDGATLAGAAYVFVRDGTVWSQQAYLKASNTDPGDVFGASVGVSGDAVVIGAPGERSNAAGVNGDQGNDSLPNAGAVYVFARDGSTWSQQSYLKASNPGTQDTFGNDISISGDTVIVAAPAEDSNATGVNGNQANNSASLAGAAYVFGVDLDVDPWTDLGFSLPGVSGAPRLVGTGTLLAGSPGTLTLSDAAPSSLSILFVAAPGTLSPFKCGTLVPVPAVFQLTLPTDGGGGVPLAWASWPAGLSGATLDFQYAIGDGAAACGVALSNALRAGVP